MRYCGAGHRAFAMNIRQISENCASRHHRNMGTQRRLGYNWGEGPGVCPSRNVLNYNNYKFSLFYFERKKCWNPPEIFFDYGLKRYAYY